jgi:hypothetical protein
MTASGGTTETSRLASFVTVVMVAISPPSALRVEAVAGCVDMW